MFLYEIDGSILTLRASGTPTLEERQLVFDAVRADVGVPNGALILLDVREVDVAMSNYAAVERLRVLFFQLGPKLGPVCAMIAPHGLANQARVFQTEAIGFALRVRLFSDEPSAREWLKTCR